MGLLEDLNKGLFLAELKEKADSGDLDAKYKLMKEGSCGSYSENEEEVEDDDSLEGYKDNYNKGNIPDDDDEDITYLSAKQKSRLVQHMKEMIKDREVDDVEEAAHTLLDNVAGFENTSADGYTKTHQELVDMYNEKFGDDGNV